MRCDFPTVQLQNVWDYVAPPGKSYCAVMPCDTCGYLFPDTTVVTREVIGPHADLHLFHAGADDGSRVRGERTLVWVCEHCIADGDICQEACLLSYRTKWRQSPTDGAYWGRRAPRSHSVTSALLRENPSRELLERSLAALYVRREVAHGFGLQAKTEVNRFADFGPAECLHDELFYKNGYDVPLPHFLQEVNRAAWLGCEVSAMHPRNRVDEAMLQRERRYAGASRAAREAAEAGAPVSERQRQELAVEAAALDRMRAMREWVSAPS